MSLYDIPDAVVRFALVPILGIPMLLYGRRLFWVLGGLTLALVGMVVGTVIFWPSGVTLITSETGANVAINLPEVVVPVLVTAVLGGLAGIVVTIRFPKAASAVVGLVGGVLILVLASDIYVPDIAPALLWLAVVAVAIAASIVAVRDPDTARITLSTFVGANTIAAGLNFNLQSPLSAIAWLCLMLTGILYQAYALRQQQAKATANPATRPS